MLYETSTKHCVFILGRPVCVVHHLFADRDSDCYIGGVFHGGKYDLAEVEPDATNG